MPGAAEEFEVLALVPARGGSKGLPRKNLIDFLGQPLVAWSIQSGLDAQLVSRVIVSTDDEEIARCALAVGAEVPFTRPAELAGDQVMDLPVFEHALEWLAEEEGYAPDVVVHLRPTSPVRPAGMVDDGIRRLLADPGADSVRSVCEPANNPFKMWHLAGDYMEPLIDTGIPEQWNQPRQVLPEAYWHTGTLDVIRTPTITQGHSISGTRIIPMIMDPKLAVDIDDERSLRHAELVARDVGLVAPA